MKVSSTLHCKVSIISQTLTCIKKLNSWLTSTYPKGLSVSMQSSLHWSVNRASFSSLLIMQLTSCKLEGARKYKNIITQRQGEIIRIRIVGQVIGSRRHIRMDVERWLSGQFLWHCWVWWKHLLTRWQTCLRSHQKHLAQTERWCHLEEQLIPRSMWLYTPYQRIVELHNIKWYRLKESSVLWSMETPLFLCSEEISTIN